jgi:hypothetical protein
MIRLLGGLSRLITLIKIHLIRNCQIDTLTPETIHSFMLILQAITLQKLVLVIIQPMSLLIEISLIELRADEVLMLIVAKIFH